MGCFWGKNLAIGLNPLYSSQHPAEKILAALV